MYLVLSASKDTYITNKIINNSFRATDANVGLAGTLDLFKLYDESSALTTDTSVNAPIVGTNSEPIEFSRVLIKFDYDELSSLLDRGKVDINSNSFKAFLSLKDVYGGQTTPNNFKIIAMPLSKSFDEGKGRDIVNFADIDTTNFITSSYSNGTTHAWNSSGALASGSLDDLNIDVIISGSLEGPSGTQILNLSSEQLFETGKEDLNLDITNAVSASLSGQLTNHGFLVAYSGSYEKDAKTYFVKRFGSVNASNVFNRPSIVINYDDSVTDNHRNFIFSVTGSLFLNNFHLGRPTNILSGTAGTEIKEDSCMKLILKSGSYSSTHSVSQHKVGDQYQTGIYSSSFAVSEYHANLFSHVKSANSASFTQIWSSNDLTVGYLTSSLIIKSPFRSAYDGSIQRLIVTCKNLRDVYRKNDEAKIRVFIEDRAEKVIFTKTPVENISAIFSQMYHRVVDIQTGKVVIPFDAINKSTKLSSDSEGMFFIMYMKSLTPGRTYKFEFLIKDFDSDFFIDDASGKFIIDNRS
jgi:hypothetical protein